MKRSSLLEWSGILSAAALYAVLVRLALSYLTLHPSYVTLMWLPGGVAFVMALHWRLKALLPIYLASVAVGYIGTVGDNYDALVGHALVSSIGNVMAAAAGLFLHDRLLPKGMQKPADIIPFGFGVCMLSSSLGGIVVATSFATFGFMPFDRVPGMTVAVLFGDSLAMILVYQVYISGGELLRLARQERQLLGIFALAAAVLLLLGFATSLEGMIFFLIPLLTLAAFHVGLSAVTLLSSVSMIAVIAATAQGIGPFTSADPVAVKIKVTAFCFSAVMTALGIALQNRQLRQTEDARRSWQEAAEKDVLTGLTNRRAFMPRLRTEMERAVRNDEPFAVAVLDVDHFKHINDTWGHAFGDLALTSVAEILQVNCRSLDTPARIGGEEFAILLPGADARGAAVPLERIRHDVEALHLVAPDGTDVSFTISIGLAVLREDDDETSLLARADVALYAAKGNGRNRLVTAHA